MTPQLLEWREEGGVWKSESLGFRYAIVGDGETILIHWDGPGDGGELVDTDVWYVESKRRKLTEAQSYCQSHADAISAQIHAAVESERGLSDKLKRALQTCEVFRYEDPDHAGESITRHDFDEGAVTEALEAHASVRKSGSVE